MPVDSQMLPRTSTRRVACFGLFEVSILIPCYNAEPWIRQCIQSALDQTWPSKEVIVVDDGSTDASVDVIKSFGDRIRFQQSAHCGGNAIRNQLVQLSRGEWLQFLDADDYLLPGKIAGQLAQAGKAESDIDIVYSPVIIQDPLRPGADYVAEITDRNEVLTFLRWGPLNTGGLLLKRKAVLRIGGWKEDQPCCQEHELLLRLHLAGCLFLLHNKAETVYRRHNNSASVSRRDPLLTIRTRMELTDRMVEHLESSGQLTNACRDALFTARMESARSAYRLNSSFAEELCNRAAAHGARWIFGSPALPFGYQLALRLTGFANAERFAVWMRERRSGLRLA